MKQTTIITEILAMLKDAKVLLQQQKFVEAIVKYKEIVEIDNSCSEAWQQLGNIYQQKQEFELAISAYKKVIVLSENRYLSRYIHSRLSYLYLQQGSPELSKQHSRLEIANNCLINHKYKIIYCPIPKNACTLFKSMMVEHSKDGARYRNSQEDIHHYASARKDTAVALDNLDYLTHPDYFKFAIIRNPFERLVSAYLDKIVKHEVPEIFAQELIKKVQHFLNRDYDLEKSISFQDLLYYLAKNEDYNLNEHWRSQSSLLGRELLKFDYFGQFEQLDKVIKFLENKFQFKITTNVSKNHNKNNHITNYIGNVISGNFYAEYPQKLRYFKFKKHGFPEAKHFYSSELIELVKIRFAQDIELYNNEDINS